MARSRRGRREVRPRRRNAGAPTPRPVVAPVSAPAIPSPAPPAATLPRRARALWRWPRWHALTAIPAWGLAILGIVGLISTIRSAPPLPPEHEPVRFVSGTPLTERLVILLVPQLDDRGVANLRDGLALASATPPTMVTIDRPGFASFNEISLQLFAGNVAGGVALPTSSDLTGQPPDTVARGVAGQGRGVSLIGPADWRALFALAAPPSASAASTPPKTAALLTEVRGTLAERRAALVLIHLRDLAARDLRDDVAMRGDLATVGATLDSRDTLMIVAGNGGGDLRVTLSGAGVKVGPMRTLAPNDFAPLCAVLLGAPYPSEARGRIAWTLLSGDEQHKAQATAALARQRTALVANSLPFGAIYPTELLSAQTQLPAIDAAIGARQYPYAYQLATSAVDQADRLLVTIADTATILVPRRAAPWLVAAALALALYALLLVLAGRLWGMLGAVAIGGGLVLGVWAGSAYLLQRLVTPNSASVVALVGLQAAIGAGVCVWLVRLFVGGDEALTGWRERPGWRATELLVLLAALPIAVAAYRYGLPWRLRLEETAPLFRWRSALLAPVALLLLGYAWTFWGVWRARRGARREMA